MCFYKTKESKVLIAKRDIKVYKIGVYANEGIFEPFFRSYFKKVNKTITRSCLGVAEQDNILARVAKK